MGRIVTRLTACRGRCLFLCQVIGQKAASVGELVTVFTDSSLLRMFSVDGSWRKTGVRLPEYSLEAF